MAGYLRETRDEGILLDPKKELAALEIYVDADWSGNYFRKTAEDDASTAKSRTGFVVMYAGVPITWHSKLQSQIALSTTEAEYIALSSSLREGNPLMQLTNEMRERKILSVTKTPQVFCKVFEDNFGALELAVAPKMRPQTKHINLVYHHFRGFVRNKQVRIYAVTTEEQLRDLFTKPLDQNMFVKFRRRIMGW